MAIIKDVTVKINNGTATLDAPVQFYEKDHDVELRFRLMDYKYKYDKDPQNILNSVDEDILEAYTTIVNPRGYELEQINGVVKNDVVIFRLDPTYTDELDELGTYKLQIHIKCTHSEFTIPPITFEVLQRLKGIKVVTDGEDEVDSSEILDNSSKFVSDETGKLIIEWKKGDMISSAKLNAMVDVINDAVDEEKIRQENEIEREKKANNKIQELENTRVEYVNKFDDELDSFADQVDTTMSDYETRFNALTVSQQQDAEIIDARDGEQTLRARLDRDIQKPSIIYEEVEGSHINVDTTCGYAQNVEILGNTIQDQNDLSDIRSVGDKVENQELYEIPVLSCGKNLFDKSNANIGYIIAQNTGETAVDTNNGNCSSDYIRIYADKKYSYNKRVSSGCAIYDLNKNFVQYFILNDTGLTNHSFGVDGYIRLNIGKDVLDTFQLEEGKVKTPYEPYQEDKLTILSPVQLEKVGDVADRIICKDGVWGVEKNIVTKQVHEFSKIKKGVTNSETQLIPYHILDFNAKNTNSISDLIINAQNATTKYVDGTECVIHFDTSFDTIDKVRDWCKSNGIFVKYAYKTHQFIPLPNDQQIKLRTFASKTNISFQCEIKPTLKASVPKSLGASVSSNTTQIDNLSKELQKINNLEESVASEVVTESGFTTVKNTSNGYFEDVKLEGRTLVNLCGDCIEKNNAGINLTDNIVTFSVTSGAHWIRYDTSLLKPNTTYTLIMLGIDVRSRIGCDLYPDNFPELGFVNTDRPINVYKFTTPDDLSTLVGIRYYVSNGVTESTKLYSPIILEGDHTQNPPEFFEGIKSVGQDVDEISVSSCNENLFNADDVVSDYSGYYKCDEYIVYQNGAQRTYLKQDFEPNTQYSFTFKASSDEEKPILFSCRYTDGTYKIFELKNSESNKINTSSFTSSEGKTIKEVCSFYSGNEIITLYLDGTCINKGTTPIPYTPYKENKKRILYYNDETQSWEKPILREWDSIEKHSDGKYYYHKRSGEVVLDGSEDWVCQPPMENTIYGMCTVNDAKHLSEIRCDKFNGYNYSIYASDIEGIYTVENSFKLKIYNSKLSIQDTAGFKAWLRANPVTVVYQLAEEKVYECTDLDLITYQNETNLIIESGAIVPKTTLKVHKNIANIATILQEKVNRLENNVGHVNGEIDNINTDLTSLTESIEGSCVSVDSKDGYLKDIEILGNTVQDQDNLADIRSVGDKLENQELYEIPVLSHNHTAILENTQLEEGTVATPYEPYQEQKLTILSPVQLEKVGDVADRIICKDGVWGVEKNIEDFIIPGGLDWVEYTTCIPSGATGGYIIVNLSDCNMIVKEKDYHAISDKNIILKGSSVAVSYSIGIFLRPESKTIYIKDYVSNLEEMKLKYEGSLIKYPTTQPQFIPLPHDQQIKLRTFANKTNISFGCEIEPTLKASVPKSISATVSTHTEQIDNLGREIDKIKKLEESTVSTVTTESDFTTVTETSNGYFEDVKLEGRTLVNLYPKLDANNYSSFGVTLSNDTITINANGSWRNFMLKKDVMPLKTSTYYTFVIYIIDNTITGDDSIIHFGDTLPKEPSKFRDSYHLSLKNKKGIYAFKLKTKDSFDNVSVDTRDHLTDKATSGTIVFKYMILEGDHTQNPPEYFEGIKSVGQDVDEISVESMEENIVKYTKKTVKSDGYACDFESISSNDVYYHNLSNKNIRLHIKKDDTYVKNIIIPPKTTIQHELSNGNVTYSVSLTLGFGWGLQAYNIDRIFAITRKNLADKKHLLYYNPTTDTWEKPILREWDTIEKHSDGKYYYHKRSGEIVLNGSEVWADYGPSASNESSKCFYVSTPISRPLKGDYMCDRLSTGVYNADLNGINDITKVTNSLYFSTDPKYSNYAYIRVELSKLSSQDVAGFKAWLQANNVTAVYQLAEEKVYECTSIDLMTYENETNFILNTGAITPKSTLKVMCNINNVVRELQQKVSNLENYIQHVMIDALNNALNE